MSWNEFEGVIRRGYGKGTVIVWDRGKEADARRNPVSTEPESVVSGRTIEQVAEEG